MYGSFDIRNSAHLLQRMRGCRVNMPTKPITMPTHSLLYRVSGLKNISQLFPNLSVLHGEKLYYDYALVMYEMYHLQEIGLTTLTAILRGGGQNRKEQIFVLC
ncbi:hypothetical protein J437_LFUL018091 [Ladona fulva]|uniref:Receptor L-domain domain-containing protein n=1 Tax=Ladona fulva TaxID=123851 RepID=A0A8K0KQZ8_LADFU|nr:hypothetical protein J437_LFUL018091 [Ladona fulva]